MPARPRLTKLSIQGFKSIKALHGFAPGPLTVLIGANGAGKSNFISFFRMLSHVMSGNLQGHLTQTGKAHSWLHDGPAVTPEIRSSFEIQAEKGINEYEFGLDYAATDRLYFQFERVRYLPTGVAAGARVALGQGHEESLLKARAEKQEPTPKAIYAMLQKFVVYQFHNTSFTSRMRQSWSVDDGRWLKEDAGNLAAVLHRLKGNVSSVAYYQRIVDTLRQSLPFFDDFQWEPENGNVLLSWRERGTDCIFGAHQASDGMLRFMALTTLLLQPADALPDLLILDEPELGLHPHAIATIAGLIKAASQNVQVIVATQSAQLLDAFEPQDVVVVERHQRESTFHRLDQAALQAWLGRYSLGELWDKNVLGGRPG